jgi:hypothetical protein
MNPTNMTNERLCALAQEGDARAAELTGPSIRIQPFVPWIRAPQGLEESLAPLQIPRKSPYFKTAVPEVSTPLNPRFA